MSWTEHAQCRPLLLELKKNPYLQKNKTGVESEENWPDRGNWRSSGHAPLAFIAFYQPSKGKGRKREQAWRSKKLTHSSRTHQALMTVQNVIIWIWGKNKIVRVAAAF